MVFSITRQLYYKKFLISSMSHSILFSDIDGTLAHYQHDFQEYGEILKEDEVNHSAVYRDKDSGETRECTILPASTPIGNAYVSKKSIELVKQIRSRGFLFALITGARNSTFLMRLPYLPEADIAISENGGRIYDHGALDLEWASRLESVIGRQGALWDVYRRLIQEGWVIDARDYSANFRIDFKSNPNKTIRDIEAAISSLPSEITSRTNLQKYDFYPTLSGKGHAAKYIMEKYRIDRSQSFALIDDDNDLPLAEAVQTVMLPGISHESVREALKRYPQWIVAQQRGILGVEELLERILAS